MIINSKHIQYFFLSLLILITVSISFGFVQQFAFPDPEWPLRKGDRVVLLPGEILEQQIATSRDGLQKIEVLFGKFELTGDAKLTLEVRDSSCTAVLAQKSLSETSFDSEYTHAFIFDRIPDSGGKIYCFRANFISNQPIKKEKAPRLFLDEEGKGAPYSLTNPGGEKGVGAGSLAIRPGYTNATFFANASEFFDRISQYKPFFLKGWFLITLVIIGFGLTFIIFISLGAEEEE